MDGLGKLIEFWLNLPVRVLLLLDGEFRAAFADDPLAYIAERDKRKKGEGGE